VKFMSCFFFYLKVFNAEFYFPAMQLSKSSGLLLVYKKKFKEIPNEQRFKLESNKFSKLLGASINLVKF